MCYLHGNAQPLMRIIYVRTGLSGYVLRIENAKITSTIFSIIVRVPVHNCRLTEISDESLFLQIYEKKAEISGPWLENTYPRYRFLVASIKQQS